MNERIQELITAYLHRGSTPEQERELFEACKNDPEAAEHLRQHLILSLKLRRLRDYVRVDETLHSVVSRRIAALTAERVETLSATEAIRGEKNAKDADTTAQPRRYGFRHVFGSALAAAAAVLLFFLLLPEDTDVPPVPLADMPQVTDTVIVVERDTVHQVREVSQPVYIVKNVPTASGDQPTDNAENETATLDNVSREASVPNTSEQARSRSTDRPGDLMDAPLPSDADDGLPAMAERQSSEEPGDERITLNPTESTDESQPAVNELTSPLYADSRDPEHRAQREKTRNYLEQYNTMLVSVESVQLTSADRIAY